MADTKELDPAIKKEADQVFRAICDTLDADEINYNRFDADYHLDFYWLSDDLDIRIDVQMWPQSYQVSFASVMPYCLTGKNRAKIATALNEINKQFLLGFMLMDEQTGRVRYMVSQSYNGSMLGQGAYRKLLQCCFDAADEYNEKLFLYDRDMITYEQLFAEDNKED
ncbi:MAG: hypothetical protein FWC54_01530 [Actinomycetia bacterium]|nr:hypothetical protein [Actinomycetes bacterium]